MRVSVLSLSYLNSYRNTVGSVLLDELVDILHPRHLLDLVLRNRKHLQFLGTRQRNRQLLELVLVDYDLLEFGQAFGKIVWDGGKFVCFEFEFIKL